MKSLHSTHYLMSFLMMALSFNIAHGTSSITLIDAVLEKDNQALQRGLDSGVQIDAQNEHGETALIWACYMGNSDAVDLLLKRGANPNTTCKAGMSPLMAAASNGHLSVIKALLAVPEIAQPIPEKLIPALHLALEKGHDAAALLIQQAVEALKVGGHNQTAVVQSSADKLIQACHLGDRVLVEECLKQGSKIDGDDTPGCMTPLVVAIAAGNKEVVDLLLERGASVNKAVKDDWTPFITACHYGRHDMVQSLMEKGADIDARTRDGWSGLELSTANKKNEIAAMLMKKLMTLPWAETDAKSPDDSDKRLCIRRNPTRSSEKSGCVKMGDKLTLNGFWTDDGWAQVILPYNGWVRTDKINTSNLPDHKRGVLISQARNEEQPRKTTPKSATIDNEPQSRTHEGSEQDYQENSTPRHFRRHNWR